VASFYPVAAIEKKSASGVSAGVSAACVEFLKPQTGVGDLQLCEHSFNLKIQTRQSKSLENEVLERVRYFARCILAPHAIETSCPK
jgi:hypothetical protein